MDGWKGVTWGAWERAWWKEYLLRRTLLKPTVKPVSEEEWEARWRSIGQFLIENPDEVI